MDPRLVILETSQRRGFVALALGNRIVGERTLDEARRHARDLAPACAALLAEQGWKPRDLAGIIVSRGPGSYTGLRVGIMSAKTLAYATGAALLGIDTFAALALQAPSAAPRVDIIADAQRDKVYVQRFGPELGGQRSAEMPLGIAPAAEWIGALPGDVWVSGPALEQHRDRLPAAISLVEEVAWRPHGRSLLRLGLARLEARQHDDVYTLEPLYLRPSSAEETWTALGR